MSRAEPVRRGRPARRLHASRQTRDLLARSFDGTQPQASPDLSGTVNDGEKLVHGSGGIVSLRAEQNSARQALPGDGEGEGMHTVELYRKVRLASRSLWLVRSTPSVRRPRSGPEFDGRYARNRFPTSPYAVSYSPIRFLRRRDQPRQNPSAWTRARATPLQRLRSRSKARCTLTGRFIWYEDRTNPVLPTRSKKTCCASTPTVGHSPLQLLVGDPALSGHLLNTTARKPVRGSSLRPGE